jgi:hypothetical protein
MDNTKFSPTQVNCVDDTWTEEEGLKVDDETIDANMEALRGQVEMSVRSTRGDEEVGIDTSREREWEAYLRHSIKTIEAAQALRAREYQDWRYENPYA